jgi:hypothetical protein
MELLEKADVSSLDIWTLLEMILSINKKIQVS